MGGATSILRAVGKLHDTARVQTARARAPQNLWRAIRVDAAETIRVSRVSCSCVCLPVWRLFCRPLSPNARVRAHCFPIAARQERSANAVFLMQKRKKTLPL